MSSTPARPAARTWVTKTTRVEGPRAHVSWGRAALVPLALALTMRLALVWWLDPQPAWDGVVYVRAAEQLAAGEGYTIRILDPANPPVATAFYPVGYPALLAVARLAGGGLAADRALTALWSALLVPLAFAYARRAFGARAARYATWSCALWPGAIISSATWLVEPVFALASGLALLPVLYARRSQSWSALARCGALLGVAAYVRPNALVLAALVGVLVGASRAARGAGARKLAVHAAIGLAIALGSACLPLTPWIVRNQLRMGSPVAISTNGGVNLLVGSLEDGAYERLPKPQPCRRDGLTEVQRDACFTREALGVIRRDPSAWLARGLLKTAHTFGHESAPAQSVIEGKAWRSDDARALWLLGLCRIGWLALLPCAVLGGAALVARARRARAHRPAIAVLTPVVALVLVHGVFLAGDRYHGALVPMLAALAGGGLSLLIRTLRSSPA